MNGEDFFARFNLDQQASYIDGAIEMLAYENSEVGTCAINWYYRGGGPEQLVAVLKKNPQLPVTAVLRTLVKRQCNK